MKAAEIRRHLQRFDLKRLFNELGWDLPSADQRIEADGHTYELTAVAEKRGVHIFRCGPGTDGRLPEYPTRRKIEKRLTRLAHEHLMIFVDAAKTVQVWHWVARRPGRPDQPREYVYDTEKSGDAMVQKLLGIEFPFSEEESVTLDGAVRKLRDSFDRDMVTRKFYDQFKCEHKAFLGFIKGIPAEENRKWYTSLMLNRLMFVYFVQKKGFLAGDPHYLRNRLAMVREREGKGKGRFLNFYRSFLLALFHEGLAKPAAHWRVTPEQREMIGAVPFLNGGLFDVHELEEIHPDIRIPDEAFEAVFRFFDQYEWTLDDRPIASGNEINPDVLGYIFEKYINQKQMGAYYTKEDITEYISKNTVLPFVLDVTRSKCKVAFENQEGPTVWDLLKDDPERYIYRPVRHGVTWRYSPSHPNKGEPMEEPRQLPEEIAIGLDLPTSKKLVGEVASVEDIETIHLRNNWNKPALDTCALPTETWREVIARRKRYQEIRTKLADGDVRSVNNLIILNLDICQFAQDVIENCEGPELLRALWQAIKKVTVLDPTCGSGAFLFAALNVLEPLYDGCLNRMEAFVSDLDRSSEKHHPKKFSDFRDVLDKVAAHPNRRYFVLKRIILNNLYGVDIMEEAVEICKLRLFLKLAAQVEPDDTRPNFGIEPLPDIDFNIRAGNTLVGYSTYDAVKNSIKSKFDFDNAMEKIANKAADLQQLFDTFRERQIEGDSSVPTEDKQELRRRLKELDNELNSHLASEYKIDPSNTHSFTIWLKSHQPFHWFVEFYGIMSSGGFDVVLGNPPYIVNNKGKINYTIREQEFSTFAAKNLYAFVFEKSLELGRSRAAVGLIVQLTVLSSKRLQTLQDLLMCHGPIYTSAFPRRPESIFDGVEMPVAIVLAVPSPVNKTPYITSSVQRFYTEERGHALYTMALSPHSVRLVGHRIAKIGTTLEHDIFLKLTTGTRITLGSLTVTQSNWTIYYQEACRYWVKACQGLPFFSRNGKTMKPPHGRIIAYESKQASLMAACLLNSSLF